LEGVAYPFLVIDSFALLADLFCSEIPQMSIETTKKTSTRTYGGLSESERVVERRERFLDAGLEIFGTLGIRGATVRALCKAAGLTERYFYESFADTDALFCAVYNRQLDRHRAYFMSHLPELPAELQGRIKKSLELSLNWMRDERVVRVLFIEGMAGSAQVSTMYHNSLQQQAVATAQLIRLDNPTITLSDEVLLQIAQAINGAYASLVAQWMRSGYATSLDIMVEGCGLIVRGIMSELLAHSQS
jgi:AcrR family transcriptional regulator